MALGKVTALGVLPNYFADDIDMANSIATCGMSFGIIVMPPLTQLLLDVYGWKGTLLILGALAFHYIVCGGWIKHSENQRIRLSQSYSYREINFSEKGSTQNAPMSTLSVFNIFNFELLQNVSFFNVLIYSASIGWSYTCWVIYLVPHAEDKHVKASTAAWLGTIGGIGNIFGKLWFVVSKKQFSNKATLFISCATCSVSLGLDPLLTSFSSLAVSSTVYAFSLGWSIMAGFAIMNDVVDNEMMLDAFAWFYAVYGVTSMAGGFTTGMKLTFST